MKFIANILVKVEIEADTEEFAKELLSSNCKIHLKSFGGQIDSGMYSIQSIGQRVMNIIPKKQLDEIATMKLLVKVKNIEDEVIAGLLEYGTVDDILIGNICLVNANKSSFDKLKSCYGVLSVDKGLKTLNDKVDKWVEMESTVEK